MGTRRKEQGFTLYQLLVSLVALAIVVSLGLAYRQKLAQRPITPMGASPTQR